jgi:hypothetical protein
VFPPRRIVCLTEETVETISLLGEQDRVVGTSGYVVRPPQARREKPRISAFTSVDIEKILALKPDLVLIISKISPIVSQVRSRWKMRSTALPPRSFRTAKPPPSPSHPARWSPLRGSRQAPRCSRPRRRSAHRASSNGWSRSCAGALNFAIMDGVPKTATSEYLRSLDRHRSGNDERCCRQKSLHVISP